MNDIFKGVITGVLPILIAVFSLFVFKQVDTRYFPVITEFNVTETKIQGNLMLASGTMLKSRDCELVQVVAYNSHMELIPITFIENPGEEATTREVGFQLWGPIGFPRKTPGAVTLYSRHKCNPLWQTRQQLVRVTIL